VAFVLIPAKAQGNLLYSYVVRYFTKRKRLFKKKSVKKVMPVAVSGETARAATKSYPLLNPDIKRATAVT